MQFPVCLLADEVSLNYMKDLTYSYLILLLEELRAIPV
jgi:hypothetical protein